MSDALKPSLATGSGALADRQQQLSNRYREGRFGPARFVELIERKHWVILIADRMSYNVTIFTPPVPADDDKAWEVVDGLIDAKGSVPPVFRELHDQLTARYPCICTLPDDKVDDCVWSDGLLWNNFGHRAAVLGISYSRVEVVLPFLVRTANDLGLTVFDWGGPTIYRPQPPSLVS